MPTHDNCPHGVCGHRLPPIQPFEFPKKKLESPNKSKTKIKAASTLVSSLKLPSPLGTKSNPIHPIGLFTYCNGLQLAFLHPQNTKKKLKIHPDMKIMKPSSTPNFPPDFFPQNLQVFYENRPPKTGWFFPATSSYLRPSYDVRAQALQLPTWTAINLPMDLPTGDGGTNRGENPSNFFHSFLDVEPKIGGCFQTPKWRVKIMVRIPFLKWMIWGYHYFWKHPFSGSKSTSFVGIYHPSFLAVVWRVFSGMV